MLAKIHFHYVVSHSHDQIPFWPSPGFMEAIASNFGFSCTAWKACPAGSTLRLGAPRGTVRVRHQKLGYGAPPTMIIDPLTTGAPPSTRIFIQDVQIRQSQLVKHGESAGRSQANATEDLRLLSLSWVDQQPSALESAKRECMYVYSHV